MQIKINNKIYDARPEETILQACRRLNIYIPTLCYHEDLSPAEGLCRLCLVKTSQHRGLVTSCQTRVTDRMEIITEDEDIKKARVINAELLWAEHAGKCGSCYRSGNCELQEIVKTNLIDVFDFVPVMKDLSREEQLRALKESLKNRELNP